MSSPASPTERRAHPDPHQHEAGKTQYWQPGHVSWFDTAKGFGFLTPDQGGPAVFCDYTAIASPGLKILHAGQRVIFTVTDTGRGPEAIQVLTYDEPGTDTAVPVSRPQAWARSRVLARKGR
ncbi:cold shock domain-containing protein [Nocardia sp. PE-7]|uniref:cold-shock protein n=1 Tax=Nocardia sp. PE-7 TaxID=3058426 RepID=UPI002659F6A6|nr:cold shock domain-containing protein [Nocardia sp. PE-7]WKG07597.1 cold shock domain-containing protein [Nocardia sp. PE-7]